MNSILPSEAKKHTPTRKTLVGFSGVLLVNVLT
jgi:hypothetical protein